ncbi:MULTISPECIES: signal peptidase I [unclassified Prochlorococcus]|uniref:signal peptidase I n=1 Tax=unclassified Prochlorococcus TaxID=2627481 RepID=UPI0005338D29|nr:MULTISPECIES: signal peptidase I [unclassified Prochlorococcus]KGG15381.1 Signal peptidase I [Prochlorococcus sp. MIT 0602]KGG17659.1 Signal peptidase I [Prochlorococcus sp. MIT 0603]
MTDSGANKLNTKNSGWINLILWILLALFLRWLILEPRWIPSGSMLPTFQIKDRILIEKVSPKINKIFHKSPVRNKIVIFNPPKAITDQGYTSNRALIKRVVGIPGDKIEIHNGKLVRNGKVIEEPWVIETIRYEMEEIVVPSDSLWVLGDNRNNSLDSHIWGPLSVKNIIGTAVFRYWPFKSIGRIRFPAKEVLSSLHILR